MKSKTKYSALKNNLFILKHIHTASPGRIVFGLTVILLKSLAAVLLNVYMLQFVINAIQTGRDFSSIAYFVIAIAAYYILFCVLESYYNEVFVPISDKKIYSYFQKMLFRKATDVELACFENPAFYDKYVKAISEASSRASGVLGSINSIVSCVFTVLSVSFVIFRIDSLLILFAFVPLAVSLLFGQRLNRIKYEYNMEMQEKSRKKNYVRRVFYLAEYAKEIRLSEIGGALMDKFRDSISELKAVINKYGLKVALIDYLFIAANDIIVYLGAILYASYKTIVAQKMLYGDCVVVINSINAVSNSLRGVVEIFLQFKNHALYIDNLRYFLEYEPTIKENANGKTVPSKGTITLQNVSFRYPEQESAVLRNITLSIGSGEKIALVGHNGAGKSTLIKLLMHFYEPTAGKILLNNVPINQYGLKEYRNLFATVFQDHKAFSMSVIENILLKSDISKDEYKRAVEGMKNAGIYDKVKSLPKGCDTVLTREFDDSGAVLSGGEYQKIAIARVLARDSEFVILDEPSSALDPIAEHEIFDAMMRACEGRSVIFISHRLASATLADKIYVLENGEIIESGTHSDLLQKKGRYADMWDKQSEKYRAKEYAK